MFLHFLKFELRYWFRSWMLWIFLFIIAGMVFGAVSTEKIIIGGALENTHRNAPFVIENYYSIMCLLTLLMTTAFVNNAAARDFFYGTYQLIFSTPLRKVHYLLGRYLGSALIAVIPMLGISIGILLARYMPWVDAERWGPVDWSAHLAGILVFALPNTLFIAAIIFTIAALTRSTITSFIGALLLLVAYGITDSLTQDIRHETAAMLLDPFAIRTFGLMTKYWTVADKNNLTLGLWGPLLWNRVIWIAASAAIFAFGYWRFSFAERTSRKKKNPAEENGRSLQVDALVLPSVTYQSGLIAGLKQFWGTTRVEFFAVVKSTSFIVILAAALLNMIPSLIFSAREGYGNQSLPVTYWILEVIAGTLYLFLVAIITYYAGVLVWKERDAHMDEIHDALPHSNWINYAAKFVALAGVILIIQALALLTGVIVQAFDGYHRFQVGLYFAELFGIDYSLFLCLAFLAFFIHIISPNKYIGYFLYIAFLLVNLFIWRPLHIATHLVQFGSTPDITYSDLFGFAPYLKGWSWFAVYWLLFCGLLIAGSVVLWQRGRESGWRQRMFNARLRWSGIAPVALLFLVAFAASGSWIYYNTEALNKVTPEHSRNQSQADYEKTYKSYENLPQPRVTDVKYAIDIYPDTRNITMHGDEAIRNETSQPIQDIHFTLDNNYDTDIDLGSATLVKDDRRLYYRIYKLAIPLQPGEERRIQFTVRSHTHGFENNVTQQELVQNGTFFNNMNAPQMGYQPNNELTDRNERKSFGLKEKDPMPALERNCTEHCRNSYLSNNSDLVMVDSVVSTSPGQIAIAPGSLIGEWNENGRRYFHYALDHPSMNFYSFISANYEVARDSWNGVKLEVYYDKEHAWNVPKMLNSMRKSLDYYSRNFSPYMHKEARIIEFPRVARFAQAFPGTMPYSESIGFIANLNHPDDIDMVFYVVAHEMGHQWWAYQVIGAYMQGATVLSETLAQYSALMRSEEH